MLLFGQGNILASWGNKAMRRATTDLLTQNKLWVSRGIIEPIQFVRRGNAGGSRIFIPN